MRASAPTPRRRSLVHHADFRRLWAGDALGQLGAQLTMLALPVFAVQHLHATAWQMGALTAAETAAFLVIGLPAGAWVDRMRKRNVLVTADLARATVLTIVVVAALTGHASIPMLIGAGVVISCASVFFDVAHQSYVCATYPTDPGRATVPFHGGSTPQMTRNSVVLPEPLGPRTMCSTASSRRLTSRSRAVSR